jgi:prolipoprotein diacylglyceryltransferase
MECLAYFLGFQLYLLSRRREQARIVGIEQGLWVVTGAIFGALIGSKLLAWMESPQEFWAVRSNPALIFSGKTIVGGLLGGWIGVEVAKKFLGIQARTGDACVWALAVGTAVGRVGCFLTGLDDRTYGIPTKLPWGVNFGDGVARHPTQLYESLCVLLLAGAISFFGRKARTGSRFRLFMVGYLLFRFGVEFIKPTYRPYAGLSAIQLACLAGAFVAMWQLLDAPNARDSVESASKQGAAA